MRDRVARFWDWRLKRDGTWGAFGASAKGAIFASVMGLSHESLRYVVDETPTKIGRITPYGVPIVPLSRLIDVPVDRLLCLTWNFIDEVRRKVAALGVETIVEVAP